MRFRILLRLKATMPCPLIHQMKLPSRLVLERMNCLLRQQQWSIERPGSDALSI